MGVPRSGRKITVDSVQFKWKLACKWERSVWNGDNEDRLGGVLLIWVDNDNMRNICKLKISWKRDFSVTPEVVSIIIKQAVKSGWDIKRPKNQFNFKEIKVEDMETKMKDLMKTKELLEL
jgi:hypothetical protein